jgi:talin
VEYKSRYRPLKIRLLDGTVKTILIDDSLIVAQLMVYICTKFGIANYDEYSLVYDIDADDGNNNTKSTTLRRVIYKILIEILFRCLMFIGSITSTNG